MFDRVEPDLKYLGENVFHLGTLGAGHTIKLLNNFFGMTVANAMAEVFAMADAVGTAPPPNVYDVMSAGPLHSGMMDFVKVYGVDGDPTKLEFAIKNTAKDLSDMRGRAMTWSVRWSISMSRVSRRKPPVSAGESLPLLAS